MAMHGKNQRNKVNNSCFPAYSKCLANSSSFQHDGARAQKARETRSCL